MRQRIGGIILILIGAIVLLSNLGVFSWSAIWKFWPVALVVLGVLMLIPRKG